MNSKNFQIFLDETKNIKNKFKKPNKFSIKKNYNISEIEILKIEENENISIFKNIIPNHLENNLNLNIENLQKNSLEEKNPSLFKLKRNRIKKNVITGKKYCEICQKSYLSYAALYTHNRNKHNIIPVTNRQEIFKISFHKQKFRYTPSIEIKIENFSDILDLFKTEFIELTKNYLSSSNSFFFTNEDENLQKIIFQNSFVCNIYNYSINKDFTLEIPKNENLEKSNINNILLIYSILLLRIVNDNFYFKLVVKFTFFLREYLNVAGWVYYKQLESYSIIKKSDHFELEFCEVNSCNEIPELMNDFILFFIDLNGLHVIRKELVDISVNFCHWLFINKLTNVKLLPFNM